MRKATQKTTPVSLGTKRSCPGCGTKFYDFNKEEIVCPKCETRLDLNGTASSSARIPEAKKPAKIAESSETPDVIVGGSSDDIAGASEEAFESVDELDDDEEDDLVEDIEVDDDGEDDF
jgi:uncharacterized protein (TIGR02300 family)